MSRDDIVYMIINLTNRSYMFFLSVPQAWHLVGTWSEQVPSQSNLIGMGELELMMTLHSIFVPLLLVIGAYFFITLSREERRKAKS